MRELPICISENGKSVTISSVELPFFRLTKISTSLWLSKPIVFDSNSRISPALNTSSSLFALPESVISVIGSPPSTFSGVILALGINALLFILIFSPPALIFSLNSNGVTTDKKVVFVVVLLSPLAFQVAFTAGSSDNIVFSFSPSLIAIKPSSPMYLVIAAPSTIIINAT